MEDKLFWLISVPKKTSPDVFGDLNRQTMQFKDLSQENNKFEIPDLKVGTLNSLMELSDELNKIDMYVENMTRKIAKQLFDLMEKKPDKFNIPIIDSKLLYYNNYNFPDVNYHPVLFKQLTPINTWHDSSGRMLASRDESPCVSSLI